MFFENIMNTDEYKIINKDKNKKIVYYLSGKIKEEYNMKDGKRDGEGIMWTEEGNIVYKLDYKEDEIYNTIKYYKNGNIEYQMNTINKEKDIYKVIEYKKNGDKLNEYFVQNGKAQYFYKIYKNGKLEYKVIIKDGEIDGECITYWDNGKIKELKKIINDKLVGKVYKYNYNGNVITQNEGCIIC